MTEQVTVPAQPAKTETIVVQEKQKQQFSGFKMDLAVAVEGLVLRVPVKDASSPVQGR